MVKSATTALLALLCLLLVKANIDTFRAPPASQEGGIGQARKVSSTKTSSQQPLDLNPRMSPQVPDLGSGYLFNAQRFLAKEARPVTTDKGYDQNIRLDDVVFSGAILGEGYKKALVSYRLTKRTGVQTKRPVPQRPAGRTTKTVQLAEGDELGGYTVKEIAADFILFIKGSDTIKKTLFDPDKKRQRLAPRPLTPKKTTPGVAPLRRVTPSSAKRP